MWSHFSSMGEERFPVPKNIKKGLKKRGNLFLDIGKVKSRLIN